MCATEATHISLLSLTCLRYVAVMHSHNIIVICLARYFKGDAQVEGEN